MQWFNCWGFFKTSFSILQSIYSVKFPTSNCITERWLNKAFSSLRPVRRHEVTNRWWEAGKISNIEWHWFIHIGPVCEAFLSLSCWSSSPIRHGWYICVYARLYKQPAEFSPLGSRPGARGASSSPAVRSRALTRPVPSASLWTFDTPSSEVSLTYFFPGGPSAELRRFSAGRGGVLAVRAELPTPPLLSWWVKSPPFVRRHVPVCARGL